MSVKDITIRPMNSADVPVVFALQQKYERVYPDAQIVPGELYLSPAFHDGQDVFCALEDGRLLAYAPVYLQLVDGPGELPDVVWMEIKADPDLPDPRPVKNALYQSVQAHLQEIMPPDRNRPLRLSFQYRPVETEAIEYVQSIGFACTESVFALGRDLRDPIPNPPVPEGIDLRHWKMESEAEQLAYVKARNECFPEAPISLGEWQYILGAPMWVEGTTIAAFDGHELVGNVAVFWNEAENAKSGTKAGYTEYIFVRPGWRGRGIAQAMIAEGMRYLQAHGMEQARLEVRALNEGALGVYKKLGYQVLSESRFYSKMV
jgi:ribosomal protein S18 acetylase RimI-like enzyme